MQQLSVLALTLLLLSQSSFTGASQQHGDKQWQDVPADNQDGGGAEYSGVDVGSYDQGGGEYTGSDVGYGSNYQSDYGGQMNNNGYSASGNSYNSGSSDYGEQVHSNNYGGEQVHSNNYGGEQINNNGYGGEQINNNGYVGEQVNGNGYGGEQVPNVGYGAEQLSNGGYGGDVHTTTSYSSSGSGGGYGDLNGNGYGGMGFGGNDGYGGGLSNEGWDRPVKTVVKHVLKNIAVPHPVPAPVHVPVPKYVKYFKPFAIAKPVAVPHIIPVIKHIQKPIPFFASVPVKHTVPVPKFVGLPVQVRVPRPVFIHVPKIVPVAKKVPVPVTVNIPKPYIVPIYKHVPIPVPHKVPKVINVIKEVPHYVKKPVPVYVDDHSPGFSNGGGNTLSSSSYSNHYGGSGGFENFGGSAYGNEEDVYGGSQGLGQQNDNSFNSIGLDFGKGNAADFGQQEYSNTHSSLLFNSPFIVSRQKLQGLREFHFMQQPKLQYPSQSYPRAQRTPTKVENKNNMNLNYQPQQAAMGYNYSNSIPQPGIEVNIEVSSPGSSANSAANYNVGMQQVENSNQGQGNGYSDMYYQSNKMNNPMATANSLQTPAIKLPLENVNNQFSQPVYDPTAYAEYALNQQFQQQQQTLQQEFNHSYSQPFHDLKSAQSEISSQGLMAQASKAEYYNQHPDNAYSMGYSSSYQNNVMNNMPNFANYNSQKSSFAENNNFNFNNAYNNNNNYANVNENNGYKSLNSPQQTGSPQSNQSPQSAWQTAWPSSDYKQNLKASILSQLQQLNQQQQSYAQTPNQNSGYAYNQGFNDHTQNPTGYSSTQEGHQQTAFRNTETNTKYTNYVPSGASSSSSSFSESVSSPGGQMSSATNTFLKQNEKFDQSASQNTYTSDSNIAIPGMYANSGASVSYSNSAFGNGYKNMQNFAQPASNPVMSNSPSQLNLQSQFKYQASYASSNQMNSQSKFSSPISSSDLGQFSSPSQLSVQSQQSDASQYISPNQMSVTNQPSQNQFNTYNQLNSQSQINSQNQPKRQAYSAQQQKIQPISSNDDNFASTLPSSYSNYVSSGSSNSYSPPSKSLSSYSSSVHVPSNEYSSLVEKNYNQQQTNNPLQHNNNQSGSHQQSVNIPPVSKSTYSTSYSYSYTDKKGKPEKVFSLPKSVNKPSSPSNENMGTLQNPKDISEPAKQVQYSPQISEADIQNAKSKIDEMERHIQSSASSIINVYTNSPQSMSSKNGQTFSFMDPEALGSSQSATFFQPLDPDGNPRVQYSSEDMTVVPPPSYQDPAEPLQTSLDAYVPIRPVYQPSASDQNTVYKEATSEMDDYKEAISLNTDSLSTKKS